MEYTEAMQRHGFNTYAGLFRMIKDNDHIIDIRFRQTSDHVAMDIQEIKSGVTTIDLKCKLVTQGVPDFINLFMPKLQDDGHINCLRDFTATSGSSMIINQTFCPMALIFKSDLFITVREETGRDPYTRQRVTGRRFWGFSNDSYEDALKCAFDANATFLRCVYRRRCTDADFEAYKGFKKQLPPFDHHWTRGVEWLLQAISLPIMRSLVLATDQHVPVTAVMLMAAVAVIGEDDEEVEQRREILEGSQGEDIPDDI